MDPTQTIILTTVVNVIITGLVGGFVIYVIQRKIDATIQRSVFEHQTKFAWSFEKIVEVLENTNSLFLDYRDHFNSFVASYEPIRRRPGVDMEIERMKLDMNTIDIFMALVEFASYVEYNRFLLPEEINKEIWDIELKAHILYDLAFGRFSQKDYKNTNYRAFQDELIKELGLESMKRNHSRKIAPLSRLNEINHRIMDQADRLQNLYKSVAHPRP